MGIAPAPLIPSFRGWITLGLSLLVFAMVVFKCLLPFLALNDPISHGLLVVEGWLPDYGLEIAAEEFKRDHYQKIYVTGGPLEYGSQSHGLQDICSTWSGHVGKARLGSMWLSPCPLLWFDRIAHTLQRSSLRNGSSITVLCQPGFT